MGKRKKIVIIGAGPFAEVAYEYFQYDSEYEVIAFSVEKAYLKKNQLLNLPVFPFENIEEFYPPKGIYFYAAIVYTKLNMLRTRLYKSAKQKGYTPASYISSKAFVWRNVKIGEHCFIFEDNTIQPFVLIGNNVVLWSGNHIGHHSIIRDNCFISSHVVVSGHCQIGENCFLGVNSTLINNLNIANNCIIGSGTVILSDTKKGMLYVGNPAKSLKKSDEVDLK